MRNYTNTLILLSAVTLGFLGLTACDQTINRDPAQSIPPDQVFVDEAGVETAVNGAYDALQLGGSFGGTAFQFADIGADIVQFGGSFVEFRRVNRYNFTINNGFVTDIWVDNYELINRANLVIDNTSTDVEGVNQADVDRYVGQAKFLRAAAYWQLVRWFGPRYVPGGSNDSPAAVLRTSAVTESQQASEKSRASVAEIYSQIVSDLQDSISRLGVNANPKRAGVNAARALLAEVRLYQGNFDDAASLANTVISSSEYSLASSPIAPFKNEQNDELVFSISFSSIDGVPDAANEGFHTFYQPAARGGRGDAFPFDAFLQDGADGDLRTGVDDEALGDSLFYSSAGSIFTNKFTSPQFADDFTWLRLAKTKLTRAEALIRPVGSASASDQSDARSIVNEIRTRAGLSPVSSSLSGQALLDEIISQRRFELAFEGDRRHTLRRLQRPIDNPLLSSPITPGSDRLVLPLTTALLERNGELSQNPGYN
jgi:hypothetical protein